MMTYAFLSPEPLARALHNALLFACNDALLPVLNAARLVHTAGSGALTVLATDRYRAFVQVLQHTVEGEDGDDGFLLARADATAIIAALNALKGVDKRSPVRLAVDDSSVTLTTRQGTITRPLLDGDFPDIRSKFPTGEAEPVASLGFDPKFLADLAKVKLSAKNTLVRFAFTGKPLGPVVADFPTEEDGPRVLTMPKRVNA